jgi:hypothetical protein
MLLLAEAGKAVLPADATGIFTWEKRANRESITRKAASLAKLLPEPEPFFFSNFLLFFRETRTIKPIR